MPTYRNNRPSLIILNPLRRGIDGRAIAPGATFTADPIEVPQSWLTLPVTEAGQVIDHDKSTLGRPPGADMRPMVEKLLDEPLAS